MRKLILYLILIVGLPAGIYGGAIQHPPQPGNKSHDNGVRGPCGQPEQGQGVPPPVGLCLPINDYLLPLFLSGIILGAYRLHRTAKS